MWSVPNLIFVTYRSKNTTKILICKLDIGNSKNTKLVLVRNLYLPY